MSGFPILTVNDLVNAGEAAIQTGPFGTQLAASDYVHDGIPVINVRNIGFGRIRDADLEFLNESKAYELRKHQLKVGDIVFGRKGAVERHVLIDQHADGWVQGSDCLRLRLNGKRVHPRFLSYFFTTQAHQDWMQALCSFGATMSSLNQDIVKRISFPCPPLETQRKIAGILSAYDDLIENNRRRIAILERMAEELYHEWFVRMRFPGYQNTKFVKGVPEGWEYVLVDKAFSFTGGGTPAKNESSYWTDGEVNWFTPSDITASEGIFLPSSLEKCNAYGVEKSSARLFPAYSIMLTSRATIGAIGINTTEACTNQGFITCIPNDNYPLVFLYYWLKLSVPYFELLSGGATFKELTKSTFKKMSIITPTRTTVEKFEEIARPIFRQVESLERASSALKATRDFLLGRLISGRKSISEGEIKLPPRMTSERELAHA